jgi:hypothetical protein
VTLSPSHRVVAWQQGGRPVRESIHWLKLLQFWQPFDLDDAIAACHRYGYTGILVKALDGTTWMSRYDISRDAISNLEEVEYQAGVAHADGLYYFAWTNPLSGLELALEATLTAQVARACDGVFLDVEPYAQFWGSGVAAGVASQFMQWVRAEAPAAFLALQPDPRGGALGSIRVWEWTPYVDALAGQHYWSDFGSNARSELIYAQQLGEVYGLPILPTLPGNAAQGSFPTDAIAALPGFAVWRWGSAPTNVLAELGSTPCQGLVSGRISPR